MSGLILLIGENPHYHDPLIQSLKADGYSVLPVRTLPEALVHLRLCGLVDIVPISLHHRIAARAKLTGSPGGDNAPLTVDDLDLDMRMNAAHCADTPLERFVMELVRIITPNGGSISALAEVRTPPYERFGYIVTPHEATSFDPVQWKDPESFNPDRYNTAPTSHEIDEAKCDQIGFARCPFDRTAFEVKDGRQATINNSGFGTVYGIVDGKPLPVCDHAGFAPFGFGYRRCPGEQLTIQVFEDFLRKVWNSGIEFQKLDIASPEPLPIGPTTVIGDNVGFRRSA